MSRPLRLELAGGVYHITSRGDRREDIYIDDQDRLLWLEIFGQVCKRYNWNCYAWCQMSNHYHIVLETVDANLSQGMRQLNGIYTQSVNRRHGRVGHVFQGRYKAILVERDSYLLELSRYVVLNPVRARIVRDVGKWRWSSYAAMLGAAECPVWLKTDWILGQFGRQKKKAIARYIDFVRAGIGLPAIWENLRGQVYLGNEEFLHRMQNSLDSEIPEIPRVQRRPEAQPLSFYSEREHEAPQAMAAAFATGNYTLREIAEHFGVHYSTVSRAIKKIEKGIQ
ncbi:transposase [Collimonas pratensis]|uniref:transposase n=1 Tax=Collimonas pratensis TaxID=279113 RepID=UPI0007802309|nr:transposase [Collimonas pratensis]